MTFAQPFSEYEVLDRVGAGSMGTVFKARHKKLDRVVALKVLKPSLARDTRYVERLRREARIVASLNHPNIVTGYDLGQEGGYHFFVMEFVEGKSLRELLDEWGLFAEERVLDVAIQITVALDHAFKRGVIHRDIKPANILITEDNAVKLTDMGLAKGPDNLTITRDGATVGTPQYISPEQARDPQDVDVRSDLYSLGATLYHMCTGQPPFRAETMANVLIKVLQERAPSAAGFNPELSDGLNLIIRKLLSKDPARRYQQPCDLLGDLRRVQRAEPPRVEIRDLDTGEEKGVARRIALAVAAVVVVVVVAWLWQSGSTRRAEAGDSAQRIAEFSAKLRSELGTLPTTAARIERVRQKRAGSGPGVREVLDEELDRLQNKLRDDVLFAVRSARKELATAHARFSWNHAERDLQEWLEKRIEQETGAQVADLTGAALSSYLSERKGVRQELDTLERDRRDRFRRGVDDQHQTVIREVNECLDGYDYRGAEAALQAQLRRFDELEVGPRSEPLPQELAEYLKSRRSATGQACAAQIDTQEREAAAPVQSALDNNLPAIRKVLEDGDLQLALTRLDALASNLQGQYPESRFREKLNPWRHARGEIDRLREQILIAQQGAREKRWADILRLTYEIVLGGDVVKAQGELDFRAKQGYADRAQTHRKLLDHAVDARRRLLAKLAPKRRLTDVPLRGGERVDVEVVRRDDRVELSISGGKGPVPLAMLRVADLVGRVSGFIDELNADLKAGLALWFVLSRDAEVAHLVRGGPFEAVLRELEPLVKDLQPPQKELEEAYGLLMELRAAVETAAFKEAQELVETLRSRHPQFRTIERDELARKVERGEAQEKLRESIRRRLLRGGTLDSLDDVTRALEVTYELAKVQVEPPDGWARARDGAFEFQGEQSRLGAVAPLEFDSLSAVDAPLRVDFELSFDVERGAPRLVFFTLHGVSVGIGIRADGAVVAVPVPRDLRPGKELQDGIRRALASPESDPAYVVPRARHLLSIRATPKGQGKVVVLAVTLDGKEIPSGRVQRASAKPPARIAVTALQPVSVRKVVLAGTAWIED